MQEHIEAYRKIFSGDPDMESVAPGRVNLIGEHTDYNGGYVLPAAIDRSVRVAFSPRGDNMLVIHAVDRGEVLKRAVGADFKRTGTWRDYVLGSLGVVLEKGLNPGGISATFSGDVPEGAGLSSSAALEVAFVQAFLKRAGAAWEPLEVIKAAQRAENRYVGVMCGIMDQYVSVFGEEDKAVLLDCSTLTHDMVPVRHEDVSIVVLDTDVKHDLGAAPYNERRASCEEAARVILGRKGLLREVLPQQLEANKARLGAINYRRARHVIMENERALRAVKALGEGNYRLFGSLMYASHNSLRDDFEVSCGELDTMVEAARMYFDEHADAGFGARMTGGGFGGCTVNLVVPGQEDEFMTAVLDTYGRKTGNNGRGWTFRPSQGARVSRIARSGKGTDPVR